MTPSRIQPREIPKFNEGGRWLRPEFGTVESHEWAK